MELKEIITKFANSGWDVLEVPAKEWLKAEENSPAHIKTALIDAVIEAQKVCGDCGCEYDDLYVQFLKSAKKL